MLYWDGGITFSPGAKDHFEKCYTSNTLKEAMMFSIKMCTDWAINRWHWQPHCLSGDRWLSVIIYLCWIWEQIDCMTYHEQLQQQHQQKQHVLLGLWFPGAWDTADVPSFCDCCLFLISATSVPQWLQEHRHKRTWRKCNCMGGLSQSITPAHTHVQPQDTNERVQ